MASEVGVPLFKVSVFLKLLFTHRLYSEHLCVSAHPLGGVCKGQKRATIKETFAA